MKYKQLKKAHEDLMLQALLCAPLKYELIFSENSNEIPQPEISAFTRNNKIYLPEKSMYKTIFDFMGVTDESVRMCCDHAIRKINKIIDAK